MDFLELSKIENEEERVKYLYRMIDEDARLSGAPSRQVEFITTCRYLDRYITPGARVLDLGAGTGAYSLYLAERGCDVEALELSERNVEVLRTKIRPGLSLRAVQGNALDLGAYPSATFDAVLLFGPLYHLSNWGDRLACLREAQRVCKPGGVLFVAFINHDMVFLTELSYDPTYFTTGDYDKETMRLHDFPFVFHTVADCERLLKLCDTSILHAVASDGASELLAERIDRMSPEDYAQYLKYHFYICEKPELLGMSNHLLYVTRRGGAHGDVLGL